MTQSARWMRAPVQGERQPGTQLAAAQGAAADPIVLWMHGAGECAFALIAPQRLAPGRAWRWPAWGAMPAVAACRLLGVPAYLQDGAIWVHGKPVTRVRAALVGECALVEAGFPPDVADAPGLEAVFRTRIEAQHGWRFETAWPNGHETRRC